jgi:hypothetical protein
MQADQLVIEMQQVAYSVFMVLSFIKETPDGVGRHPRSR